MNADLRENSNISEHFTEKIELIQERLIQSTVLQINLSKIHKYMLAILNNICVR